MNGNMGGIDTFDVGYAACKIELENELSATKEKLNEALESNKAVWKELESVDYAGSMDEAVRYLKRENAEIKAWKESAVAVMPDYQAISKVLEIGLGESVHDKILPAIEKLKSENAELRKRLYAPKCMTGDSDWFDKHN